MEASKREAIGSVAIVTRADGDVFLEVCVESGTFYVPALSLEDLDRLAVHPTGETPT